LFCELPPKISQPKNPNPHISQLSRNSNFISLTHNYYRVRQSSTVGLGGGERGIEYVCASDVFILCVHLSPAWLLCKGTLSYNTLVIGRIASTTSIIWKEPCLLVRIGFWPVIISYIPRPPNPTSKSS
jgi:hypothetical protein